MAENSSAGLAVRSDAMALSPTLVWGSAVACLVRGGRLVPVCGSRDVSAEADGGGEGRGCMREGRFLCLGTLAAVDVDFEVLLLNDAV